MFISKAKLTALERRLEVLEEAVRYPVRNLADPWGFSYAPVKEVVGGLLHHLKAQPTVVPSTKQQIVVEDKNG